MDYAVVGATLGIMAGQQVADLATELQLEGNRSMMPALRKVIEKCRGEVADVANYPGMPMTWEWGDDLWIQYSQWLRKQGVEPTQVGEAYFDQFVRAPDRGIEGYGMLVSRAGGTEDVADERVHQVRFDTGPRQMPLEVSGLKCAPDNVYAGSEVTITFVVANTGAHRGYRGTDTIRCYMQTPGDKAGDERSFDPDLAPDERRQLSWSYRTRGDAFGVFNVYVENSSRQSWGGSSFRVHERR